MVLDDNQPRFSAKDKKRRSAYESYAPLDSLGRCGVAFACLCKETMPTEKRGEIGQVRPSGWHTVKYDTVDGKYLYNRCHLIGGECQHPQPDHRHPLPEHPGYAAL